MSEQGGHGDVLAAPLTAVAAAWSELGGRAPTRVDPFKIGRNKRSIYRLLDAGPRGETVIAKRSWSKPLRDEWTIYAEVLPTLPLTRAHAYGFLEDGVAAWLFLEDAGDVGCDPRTIPALAGQWLGTLHGAAARLDLPSVVPSRGLDYYREQLRVAQRAIELHCNTNAPRQSDGRLLSRIATLCAEMEESWDLLEEICVGAPATIAHGDFVRRNLRLRAGPDGSKALIALDWECAGAAPPAADLELLAHSPVFLQPYLSMIQRFLPEVSEERVIELAKVGVGLRLVAAIRWATDWLACPWPETGIAELRCYVPLITHWTRSLAAWPERCRVR